jgi:hypothetical protein
MSNKDQQRQTLFLDKKVCLICTHLVGELGKKTKSCTAKKGNTKCPAQWYQLEVGVDTEQAIEDFYGAVQSGKTEEIIAALMAIQTNEKISQAVISDLKERLFDDQVRSFEGEVEDDQLVEDFENQEQDDEDEDDEA